MTAYYWSGSSWTWLNDYTDTELGQDMMVKLLHGFLDVTVTTEGDFDNFKINYGSVVPYPKDYSGFGNHGSVNGSTWNATGGYDGFGAYEFDGINDRIEIPYSSTFDFGTGSFSMGLWFNTNDNEAAWQYLITYSDRYETSGSEWSFYSIRILEDGIVQGRIRDDTDSIIHNINLSSTDKRDGSWHHALIVRDVENSLFSGYLDGI
jgi:hypothetical protein